VSYNVSDSSDDCDSHNDRTESANVVELAGPEPSTSAESAPIAADVALSPLPTSYGVDTTEEDEGLLLGLRLVELGFKVNVSRSRVSRIVVCIFGRPFVKRFALCYRSAVCPVCSVCLSVALVYCGQTV